MLAVGAAVKASEFEIILVIFVEFSNEAVNEVLFFHVPKIVSPNVHR